MASGWTKHGGAREGKGDSKSASKSFIENIVIWEAQAMDEIVPKI